MKILVLQLVAIFGLASVLVADDTKTITLTPDQTTDARHQLEAYEEGKIGLDDITTVRDEAWGQTLVAYYLTHTNDVTIKMKLPIGRCYGAMGKYPEALQLAQEYVSVYSNDWHGWRIIGSANLDMKNFSDAVDAYAKAVRLGDDGSCAPLAFTAMKIDRLDVVRDIVPRLLAVKDSKATQFVKPLDGVTALVLYSLRSNQEDIFVKALSGLNASEILARNDLVFLVRQGCQQFKGKDIDKIRQKMGISSESNSNTNAISNPSP